MGAVQLAKVSQGRAANSESSFKYGNAAYKHYSVSSYLRMVDGDDGNKLAIAHGQRSPVYGPLKMMHVMSSIFNGMAIPELTCARHSIQHYEDTVKTSLEIPLHIITKGENATLLNRKNMTYVKKKVDFIFDLIDGQQRTISLSVAFNGSYEGDGMHLNLDDVNVDEDGAIEFNKSDFAFYSSTTPVNSVRLSRMLAFENFTNEEIYDELKLQSNTDDEREKLLTIINQMYVAIFDRELMTLKYYSNPSAAERTELFVTPNSTSTPVTDIDLCYNALSEKYNEEMNYLSERLGKFFMSYNVSDAKVSRDFALRLMIVACSPTQAKMNDHVARLADGKDTFGKYEELYLDFIDRLDDMLSRIDKELKSNGELRSSIADQFAYVNDDEAIVATLTLFIVMAYEASKNNANMLSGKMSGTKLDQMLYMVSRHRPLNLLAQNVNKQEKANRFRMISDAARAMVYGVRRDDEVEIGKVFKPLTWTGLEIGYNAINQTLFVEVGAVSNFMQSIKPTHACVALSVFTDGNQNKPDTQLEHIVSQKVIDKNAFEALINQQSTGYVDHRGLYQFAKDTNNTLANMCILPQTVNGSLSTCPTVYSKVRKLSGNPEFSSGTLSMVLREYGIANYVEAAEEALFVENIPFQAFAIYCKYIRTQQFTNTIVLSNMKKKTQVAMTMDEMLERFFKTYLVTELGMSKYGTELDDKLKTAVNEYGYIIG
jgi:hypothetical protein|tara:strand:+ start:68 stop:2206 length:2139 start_codon:yes stop_codon:yes gene_type:complete